MHDNQDASDAFDDTSRPSKKLPQLEDIGKTNIVADGMSSEDYVRALRGDDNDGDVAAGDDVAR